MEKTVKILLSSKALYKALYSLDLDYRDEDSIIRIEVSGGKMVIDTYAIDVEHKGDGLVEMRAARLVYLRGILSRVEESPVVLIINGDNLFLSEIYI